MPWVEIYVSIRDVLLNCKRSSYPSWRSFW
jgi:hypothetical protein